MTREILGVSSSIRGWSLARETLYWSLLYSLATLSITMDANSSLITKEHRGRLIDKDIQSGVKEKHIHTDTAFVASCNMEAKL